VVVVGPGRGLFVRERVFIPLWVTALEGLITGLWHLVIRLLRFLIHHPISTAVTTVLVTLWRVGGLLAILGLLALVSGSGAGWAWRWPSSFDRHVVIRGRSWWRWQRLYKRAWRPLMDGCGLVETRDYTETMPQIADLAAHPHHDILIVTLAAGQIPADITTSTEAIAHGLGAWRVTATPAGSGTVTVTVMWTDPIGTVIHPDASTIVVPPVQLTAADVTARLDAVPVGVTEAGTTWTLPVVPGRHLLVSGSTGSGKSGLLWAILWQLRDLITAGWITVTALDPKYVELRAVQTSGLGTVVVDAPTMPAVLEGLVAELDARCAAMPGRSHTPSPESPVRVVIVDELATLTALSDNKSKARVEQALGHLLSRGRAAGYLVILTSVEATKEVVRWRGLCSTRVCYRTDDDQADLVLGDGAHDAGAQTELIPENTPGIAYARIDGRAGITRVRTLHVTDAHLAALTTPVAAPALEVEGRAPDTAEIPVLVPTRWSTT
jgi:S-DNA-T family DNA segregation ATPase FtsK/SpoIIIE